MLFLFFKCYKQKNQQEWRLIFLISTIVYSFGAFIFLFFASTDTQEWAKTQMKQKNEEKELIPLNLNTDKQKEVI